MQTKIFIACFLGAFIGALVALQMHEVFWWIGMLVGAGAGYMSYEFKTVLATIPRAYEATRGWRPDGVYWKIKLINTGGILGLTQTLLAGLFLSLVHTLSDYASLSPESLLSFWHMTVAMHVMMSLVGFSMPVRNDRGEIIQTPLTYGNANPITTFAWHLPRGIFYAIRWVVRGLPQVPAFCLRVSGFLKRFSVYLFREIHSDARLLCACDASIGAAIGYFTGNTIVGGIAGGILGVLNYEIVSKRILGFTSTR